MLEISIRPPRFVLVHSMGKVGSYSIYKSLQKTYRREAPVENIRVLHTHQLNRRTINKFVAKVEGKVPGHIADSEEFLHAYKHAGFNGRTLMITTVREPLGRNMSAFFENLRWHGFPEDLANVPIEDLLQSFVTNYPHHTPARWFMHQIKDVFGIDVFEAAIDSFEGGRLIRANGIDLLLLRVEDSQAVWESALRKLTGFESFELQTLNTGEDKSYNEAYKLFKHQFQPVRTFVDELYDSQFARHFYSHEELEGFRHRWVG